MFHPRLLYLYTFDLIEVRDFPTFKSWLGLIWGCIICLCTVTAIITNIDWFIINDCWFIWLCLLTIIASTILDVNWNCVMICRFLCIWFSPYYYADIEITLLGFVNIFHEKFVGLIVFVFLYVYELKILARAFDITFFSLV